MAQLAGQPQRQAKLDAAVDRVLGGSNYSRARLIKAAATIQRPSGGRIIRHRPTTISAVVLACRGSTVAKRSRHVRGEGPARPRQHPLPMPAAAAGR
jgi:hypothetical protein